MYRIDDIMKMLDCNNSIEIQQKGIELAKDIKSINAFILPKHDGCNKNVWENCAKILASKSDEIIYSYTTNMLEWVGNLDTPGAEIILERLKKVVKTNWLSICIKESVKVARVTNNHKRLSILSQFLDVETIKNELPIEIIEILKSYYNN